MFYIPCYPPTGEQHTSNTKTMYSGRRNSVYGQGRMALPGPFVLKCSPRESPAPGFVLIVGKSVVFVSLLFRAPHQNVLLIT